MAQAFKIAAINPGRVRASVDIATAKKEIPTDGFP